MVSCFVTENMIFGDFYRGRTIVTVHVIFIQCLYFNFPILSSSGGGIPMWIGALQVIKKTSQHTTLGFGHVGLFFLFFNYRFIFGTVSVQQGWGCLF